VAFANILLLLQSTASEQNPYAPGAMTNPLAEP
jgi:hypothetical protein